VIRRTEPDIEGEKERKKERKKIKEGLDSNGVKKIHLLRKSALVDESNQRPLGRPDAAACMYGTVLYLLYRELITVASFLLPSKVPQLNQPVFLPQWFEMIRLVEGGRKEGKGNEWEGEPGEEGRLGRRRGWIDQVM